MTAAVIWLLKTLGVLLVCLVVAASVLLGLEWRRSAEEDAEADRRNRDQTMWGHDL
jgi:hypothetical protein